MLRVFVLRHQSFQFEFLRVSYTISISVMGISIPAAWSRGMAIHATFRWHFHVVGVKFDGDRCCGRGDFDGVDVKEEVNNYGWVSLIEREEVGVEKNRKKKGDVCNNLQRKSKNATLYKPRI